MSGSGSTRKGTDLVHEAIRLQTEVSQTEISSQGLFSYGFRVAKWIVVNQKTDPPSHDDKLKYVGIVCLTQLPQSDYPPEARL